MRLKSCLVGLRVRCRLIPTALRGLRSGEPAVGLCVLWLSVLPGVQRSTPWAGGAHQVRVGDKVKVKKGLPPPI